MAATGLITHKLVLTEHLNHYGYLFGGQLLKWVDEVGWIAAGLDYPGRKFVTVAMDRVEFKRSIKLGSTLRFETLKERMGRTSVTYEIVVFNDNLETGAEEQSFSTRITFVCVDDDGEARSIIDG
uniref:Putative Cytosolic long-chain acyl-CoA thioester hydrolase family protein n=1 Tax=Magnetococcus massalia (strain MO-1) TaxID=451514 RepID=A0A1S7LFB1_MAGMO|nr:putative Cytosolic long-chain acyl-CoA thioester hydrolase family protein [Candidatus Magnetococcus massalia]